jgi:hydrogenase maturation protein HypF
MTVLPASTNRIARRISIAGIVQGVGFRPFVYRTAAKHGVAGWVLNDTAGVEIHAEAPPAELASFLSALRTSTPPAAHVTRLAIRDVEPQGTSEFSIRASHGGSPPTVRIAPDLAVCADCLAEMRDPQNARVGYPYINCTNCGPRFSIICSLPYDRAATTMRPWEMCPECRRQYSDPLDRRYHAQPIACADCGPTYMLIEGGHRSCDFAAALYRTVELLRAGGIVAIKGIGGFHLACDALNAAAVEALRARKYRKERPFAVLARDRTQAAELVDLTPAHEALLTHVSRPVVLARAKAYLPGVAPDNISLGVMLPSTPIHHLLFDAGAPSPLVMTSANRSSEPIAYLDDDAKERLSGIADALLIGERPIARRIDDSVVAVRAGGPFMMRRARGFAPASVCRLKTSEPILALGGDLKNAIALVVDGEVFMSQHIGDLGDIETEKALSETIYDLLSMYRIDSRRLTIVHDLHPEFASTRLAATWPARCRVAIQHHHAHVASVMAEHSLLDEPMVGVALDGTGYGTDAGIWGGEIFVGSAAAGFERAAYLRPVQMPGGDAAAKSPVQSAAAFLAQLPHVPDMMQPPFCFPPRFLHARSMVVKNLRCFTSTSMGRLFDAVAAILGFTRSMTFEGQAAVWLEYQAQGVGAQSRYQFRDFDFRPLLTAILQDRRDGRSVADIAYGFHAAVATEVVNQICRLCEAHGLGHATISGGVFQNELLFELVRKQTAAEAADIELLWNRLVPANDGGIALGQAALVSVTSSACHLISAS